jgi:hypothetical protein
VMETKMVIGEIVERKPRRPVAPSQTSTLVTADAAPSSVNDEIDSENRKALRGMTQQELQDHLEWINGNISPENIEFLKNKSRKQ